MKIGLASPNSSYGVPVAEMAADAEQRGYDSLWVGEHSHIPASRLTPHPSGIDLPRFYWHMRDPFVSLAAASAVTERLVLGTAVSLILQHDMIDLAKETATLDVLCDGRFILGIGVGWNAEELADHRPELPFRQRYRAMRERVAALRTLWSDSEAGFEGTWDRCSPSWVFPKPTGGGVPIALGNWGPIGMDHAAEYADHWMPIDHYLTDDAGEHDVAGGIERFRRMVAEKGRDPDDVPVSLLLFSRPTPSRLDRYAELGVQRVVASVPSAAVVDADFVLRDLDEITPLVAQYQR